MSQSATEMTDAGDLGRHIIERRKELGLTVAQVAERAGMAADYIEYVEQTATDISNAALMRLARALEMFNEGEPVDYPSICMFREALREYFTADAELDGLVSKAVGS